MGNSDTGSALAIEKKDSSVAEAAGDYDEEQWKSSFDEAESVAANGESAELPDFDEADAGPVPSLEEMLAKIPERNQELLEGLFRGRFVTVQRLDRKKLY